MRHCNKDNVANKKKYSGIRLVLYIQYQHDCTFKKSCRFISIRYAIISNSMHFPQNSRKPSVAGEKRSQSFDIAHEWVVQNILLFLRNETVSVRAPLLRTVPVGGMWDVGCQDELPKPGISRGWVATTTPQRACRSILEDAQVLICEEPSDYVYV
jgi:hypothetical protein